MADDSDGGIDVGCCCRAIDVGGVADRSVLIAMPASDCDTDGCPTGGTIEDVDVAVAAADGVDNNVDVVIAVAVINGADDDGGGDGGVGAGDATMVCGTGDGEIMLLIL